MRAGRHVNRGFRLAGEQEEREQNDVLRIQSDAGIVSVPACGRSVRNVFAGLFQSWPGAKARAREARSRRWNLADAAPW